jgi:hypothetical protein
MARDNGIYSVAFALEKWLSAQAEGQIIFPSEIPLLASPKTIGNLLAKAAQEGRLERLAAGIYAKPRYHPLLGTLRPGLEAVAEAIARRDGARVIPTGALALNQLGLSTQVPMRIVYLTDGEPRTVKVGSGEIQFRKAPLKLLVMKGHMSLLATLAMRELGQAGLDDRAKEKIIGALAQEEESTLEHDAKLVPAWMLPYFQQALKAKANITQ